jgi:hypothetical protein
MVFMMLCVLLWCCPLEMTGTRRRHALAGFAMNWQSNWR